MTHLALFVASWIVCALGGAPVGAPAPAVAYVNGAPVTGGRLELAVAALLPRESFHRSVRPEKLAELKQRALEEVVNEELQYQEAERIGLAASVGDVEAALADLAARYETPAAFAAARRRARVSIAGLRRELRRSLLIRKARADAVDSRCAVGRAEAASYFDAHRERFVVPEELHVQAITIGVDPSSRPTAWTAAKARAAEVRRRLEAGAAFEAMAREYSTDPSRETGGDMGFFHRGSLADDFERATRDLGIGEVSPVVRTIYGYHLVRVTEVRPSRQKTFAEVGAELEQDLTEKRCAERGEAWLAGLRANAEIASADGAREERAQESLSHGGVP